MCRPYWYIFLMFIYLIQWACTEVSDSGCKDCPEAAVGGREIVNVERDFNKLKTDPELTKHLQPVLDRLKVFKVPVHPRIRLFYELLKVGMQMHARRTADSLYVPDKYNVAVGRTTQAAP